MFCTTVWMYLMSLCYTFKNWLNGKFMYSVLWLVAQSRLTLCDPIDCSPPDSCPWNSPGKNMGVGCHALLQGIVPTQELNPGLPHCRWILSSLSHRASPRILNWVIYPFSRGASRPRGQTGISCIAGRLFTSWATWEAQILCIFYHYRNSPV